MNPKATPPFLAWTFAQNCDLKQWIDVPHDPMQVERHLRGIQAIGEAHADGRWLDGVCCQTTPQRTDPSNLATLVFREEEVASGLGGVDCIRHLCGNCPVNLPVGVPEQTLAGCFGWLVLDDAQWTDHIESVVESGSLPPFPRTTPAWFGFWMTSRSDITPVECEYLVTVFDSVALRNPASSTVKSAGFDRFRSALKLRMETDIPLSVRLYPPGEIRDTDWWIPTHCSECASPTRTDRYHRCSVCWRSMRPEPRRRRKRRGNRPYTPIDHILNTAQAKQWLEAYCS